MIYILEWRLMPMEIEHADKAGSIVEPYRFQ